MQLGHSSLCIVNPSFKGVFERRTSTGSELFAVYGQWLCQNFRADRLYQSKEIYQFKFVISIKAY